MNINLLPREPFVVQHFSKLVLLIISLLLLISTLVAQYIMHQNVKVVELQKEIQDLQTRQGIVQGNMDWNAQVSKREEELINLRRYQALTDGIEMGLKPHWKQVLDELQESLPEHAQLLELNAQGNQVQGKAVVYTLAEAAYFADKLQEKDSIDKVFIDTEMPGQESENIPFQFNSSEFVLISFTIVTHEIEQKGNGSHG